MSLNVYLHLLFFCGIFFQEIFATISDQDTKSSSDLLVRNRRVISHLNSVRNEIGIEPANYLVKIREEGHLICEGVILSHSIVITAAPCVFQHISMYQIISNAVVAVSSQFHNITSKEVNNGRPPHQMLDAIALLTVHPLFEYSRRTGNVALYVGPLHTGTIVRVFGWGNVYGPRPARELPKILRKIDIPIMNNTDCQAIYDNHFHITEKHICTYDELQYCAEEDAGGPLIIDNRLAGIHIWKGQSQCKRNPDVFINLQHPDYSGWIRRHIDL